jgi:hypothetical protein
VELRDAGVHGVLRVGHGKLFGAFYNNCEPSRVDAAI